MRKVLIIAYHFPPINNINARRFGGMVAFMPKFGWEPVVLTTKTDGPLPVLMPQENVIRIGKNYDSKKKLVVSEEGYKRVVRDVRLFLEGKDRELLRSMKARMNESAGRLNFEEAARIRDRIFGIEKVIERQRIVSAKTKNIDFI